MPGGGGGGARGGGPGGGGLRDVRAGVMRSTTHSFSEPKSEASIKSATRVNNYIISFYDQHLKNSPTKGITLGK